MKNFWSIFNLLVVGLAACKIAYVALWVPEPTNSEIVRCIFLSLCIIVWKINDNSSRSTKA